jgi:hypothetical protein
MSVHAATGDQGRGISMTERNSLTTEYDRLKAQMDAMIAKQEFGLPDKEAKYVAEVAASDDLSPKQVITSAVRVYQLWKLGHLIESGEYKAMRRITP